MKTIEEVKEAVRDIRAGRPVEWLTIDGDTACTEDGQTFQVLGQERLRLVPLTDYRKETVEPKKAKEQFNCVNVVCSKCGVEFIKSKFNPYFTECRDCRKKSSGPAPTDRVMTCTECNKEFTVSKFHPYLNMGTCPVCNRKAALRRYKAKSEN